MCKLFYKKICSKVCNIKMNNYNIKDMISWYFKDIKRLEYFKFKVILFCW